MMRAVIVPLLSLIATPALAQLAIDCAKPVAPIDKLVCADEKLAAVNRVMGERYETLRRAMSREGFALARTLQRDWLKQMRSRCASDTAKNGVTRTTEEAADCIGQAYRDRGDAIDSSVRIAGGMVLEGRRQVRTWPKYRVTETNNYPWLTGTPADRVAAFNRHIKEAVQPAQSLFLHSGIAIDPKIPGETVFDRFYEIHWFDERLISIEIFNHHEANFGHGWRSEFIINWNLAQNRPLAIGDLFATDRGWQQAVADAALKLAREDYNPQYAEEMISPAAVDSADVWLFDSDGATLMLGHGERSMVGASIEVTVPYEVLAPYLRPDAPLPGAGVK